MAEEMGYTDEKIQEPEAQPAQEPVLEEQPKPEEPEEKAEPVKETDQPKASQEPAGENRRTFQGRRLHFGDEEDNFYRDEEIISKLEGEDLLKYLAMEQEKEEHRREAKEVRERRIFSGFQLTISLAAIVAVVGFLKDYPTVLVNILYIVGILIALWILRQTKDQ